MEQSPFTYTMFVNDISVTEFNYGTPEMPWDKWFATYHNGTEEDTLGTRERKKRMYNK